MEELGRQLAAGGAAVRFHPTVAHRLAAGPAATACLVGAAATAVGLAFPLVGIAALLLVLWAAVRDADGGRSWLRRALPSTPGWAAEVELQPGPSATPTLLLWIPVADRAHGRLGAMGPARAALAVPAALGLVACLGLALSLVLPQAGRAVSLFSLAGLLLCAPLALVLLRANRPLDPAVDPTGWLPGLAQHLARQPLPGVRLLLWIGSEGALWHDDLAVLLASRRHRYTASRTLLVAVQPGRGPLSVVERDGLVHLRPAPASVVASLRAAGLPAVTARTAASRARALGVRAVGLIGTGGADGPGPQRLETALRCLADALPSRPEDPP